MNIHIFADENSNRTFSLSESKIVLNILESKKLKIIYSGLDESEKIYWSSSDKSVASVTNAGNVCAISTGKAVITAKTGKSYAYCTVYVKEIPPKVYQNSSGGFLYGFKPNCNYLIDGTPVKSDENGEIRIISVWNDKQISIIKQNSIAECNSDVVTFKVTHIHFYSADNVFKPTCTEKGYTFKYCVCGDYIKTDIKEKLGHSYSGIMFNESFHFKKCLRKDCNSVIEREAHIFVDGSSGCSLCGYVKPMIQDGFTSSKLNGKVSTCANHIFDNDCDSICNICGYKRSAGHIYDNSCDDVCNYCNEKRSISHTYRFKCSKICEICGFIRETQHTFDDENDTVCNVCGAVRTVNGKSVKSVKAKKDNNKSANAGSEGNKTDIKKNESQGEVTNKPKNNNTESKDIKSSGNNETVSDAQESSENLKNAQDKRFAKDMQITEVLEGENGKNIIFKEIKPTGKYIKIINIVIISLLIIAILSIICFILFF